MADKGEKKSLQDQMMGSFDSVKSNLKNLKLPEVKLPDFKILEIKTLNVNLPQAKDLFKKTDSTETDQEDSAIVISSISTRNSLKIIYYLIAVDGRFTTEEEEKFDLLGKEITPDYPYIKDRIISECQSQMDKVIDPEDYYDVLQDGVEEALLSSIKTEDTFITPKLLVWDLLTIAYSDGAYDEKERKLIKYIVRKLDIDKAVFLEMESSIQTLQDLEKEQQWIKTIDRPYLTIEGMLNEIEDRKHVIFDSAKDLITL